MVETHICLSVNRLLNEETYAIPLYQRNFSWTYDEIEQLLNDVADAFKEKRDNYYIGTLVVNEENGIFKIIDGQQRTTALNLIALVLKNEFDCDRLEAVRLTFPARRKSNENIQKLFTKQKISEDDENELTRGYRHAKDAIENVLGERQLDTQSFVDYLFNKVIIFRSILPKDLDLNLYFERFNSRGEQLEAHEILKAQMMAKFGEDQEMAQKFARIWDACADFDKPVINAFTKKAKKKHSDAEREKIFPLNWIKGNHYQNSFLLNIDESLSQIEVQSSNKKPLLSSVGNKESITVKVVSHTNEVEKYRTIINFETFLYFVYYITFGNVPPSDIQLDDKKLLETFENITSVNTGIEDVTLFIRNLLKLKFIFDNLIVRMSQETNNRRQENDWFLQKVYRNDYNNKVRGDLFVQYYYDKNSFEKFNDDILMLQSMFAVTFTANRNSRWLYEILQFLYRHIEELNDQEFGARFKDFLEKMAMRYAEENLFDKDRRIKKYWDIPVYAFNFVDYVLWKNREELKKDYDVKFEDFKFAYRRSIEHWFPQHPNSDERVEKLDDKFLHSFGNLCIITDSQNSKFGNLVPSAKYKQWEGIFNRQSLKLQMMADVTVKNDKWGIREIQSMEKEVERYVHDFCFS
ncbi:DUF262 domain-containing protein [Streptococcus infantis]|uniref:DUF262 domain-containing protein n=1 Tax=Streptococcus infantis TaxID=68892 RepID=UPI0039C4E1E2